jgi:hypothetical protein
MGRSVRRATAYLVASVGFWVAAFAINEGWAWWGQIGGAAFILSLVWLVFDHV